MIEFRKAEPGELVMAGLTAEGGQYKIVSVEDGRVTGWVCCSVVEKQAYLHDIGYIGASRMEVIPVLGRKGLRWIWKQGFKEWFGIATTSESFAICEANGGKIQGVVFKMEFSRNKETK